MAQWDAEREESWIRSQARRGEVYGAATERMLELADVRTGNRVIDVAAGTGDQTLLAAQRVGPSGYVLATDISTDMLNIAADVVGRAGLTNVGTRVMDSENLNLDADSFDAVICRLGLHLFSDPPKALRGMRRVAKPGGKVAALVFSAAEKNPYEGVPRQVAQRRGRRMSPVFALGEHRLVEDAFRNGGFSTVLVHAVATHRRFSSSKEAVENLQDDFHGRNIAELPSAEREQAWEEVEQQFRRFEGPNGCELPGELLIGVGTK
jgi:ubiquinone/menaquinone biosynthesis C-methylase UbiE